MKVILLKDVPKIGQRGDIKEVAEGFALNLLLPQGKAERSTPEKIAAIQKNKHTKLQEAEKKTNTQLDALKKIASITISVRATTEGGLFEAITPHKIAIAVREQGLGLPDDSYDVKTPIKKTGNYTVPVTVGSQHFNLSVIIKGQ
jgi:large subunit ribosomal protein L9